MYHYLYNRKIVGFYKFEEEEKNEKSIINRSCVCDAHKPYPDCICSGKESYGL